MRSSAALFLAAALHAAGVPTIDESLSMKSVSSPRISPDGRYVAYHVTSANWEENEFVTQIWLASLVTGERYQLTSGKKSATGPEWSPGSRQIAFVSDRDGKRQIYLIPPAGGEAAQLTAEENGVGEIAWAPGGGAIAFTSTGPDSPAMKARKEKYGEYQVAGGDYTMTHLWLVQVPAEIPADPKKLPKPEPLTSGAGFTVNGFSWSPDGKHIAFSAQRDPDLGSSDTEQVYVLDLEGRRIHQLTTGSGPNGNPKWSPGGRRIAYTTSNGSPSYYYTNRYIAAISAEGGAPEILTAGFDEDANLACWSPAGIYFTAQQKTVSAIFRLDPATKQVTRISTPADFSASAPSFTADFQTFAATGAAPNRFSEVFTTSSGAFAPRTLTDVSAQYRDFSLATREVIQWKSADGTPIEGILIKPASYDPARKYPLLVVIH
ncbi:MAG: PD40 domain-containing protein, partial [Acidobacteriota bacterium]|nr:PD40 domain-containing protein [Acidobacteriota bacterium]